MRFLLGNRNRLYPFEASVIEAIKSRLSPEGASQLQAQADSINKVQRLTDGKEVNLYRVAHGKPAFDDRLRFPGREGEDLLGTVHLTRPGSPTTLRVEAWLASGRLFSLIFDKPPKRFFAGHALDAVRPAVADVTAWADPMGGRPKGGEAKAGPAALKGWLQELAGTCQLTDTQSPLVESQQAAFVAQIDARLPPDFLELAKQMDGARAGECAIHGLASVREVALANDNFYILAEDKGGALAVKGGSRDGELYVLSYERDDVRPLNQAFRTALVQFCSRSDASR